MLYWIFCSLGTPSKYFGNDDTLAPIIFTLKIIPCVGIEKISRYNQIFKLHKIHTYVEFLSKTHIFFLARVLFNLINMLSVWGQLIFFLFLFSMPDLVFLLKGMGETFLLSKDEPLTPNIDGVMAL